MVGMLVQWVTCQREISRPANSRSQRGINTSVPPLRLEITGATPRADLGLLTALPAGASAVPYFHSFTADSASTTLRFSLVNPGDSAAASQIAGLQVAEPLTLAAATLPNARQQAQIDRRYGLFLHFGINTFHNQEWTDGSCGCNCTARVLL